MRLIRAEKPGWYRLQCTFEERGTAKRAGCWWNTRVCPDAWATRDLAVAYALREAADPALRAEIEAAYGVREGALQASRATDADVDVPVPAGLAYLPFQRAGVAYALARPNTLIADSMGLGKTISALGVANATNPKNILVICPASLKLNWLREAQRWLVRPRNFYVVDSKKEIPTEADFVICNYERADVIPPERHWDLLIVDEAHRVKNPKTKRTRSIVGSPGKKDAPRTPGLVDRADRSLFLTGTPILNRPVELFPLLSALDPYDLGKNFFGFAKRYCSAHQGKWGWDFTGSSHLDELQLRLRERVMVRRLKSEVLTELPPKRRQLVALTPDGARKVVEAEAKAWQAREDAVEAHRAAADLAWASGNDAQYKDAVAALQAAARLAFTEISAARHEVALAKVPAFVEYAIDALEATDKIVIFGHHRDVVDLIVDGLREYQPVRVTGEDSVEARDAAVTKFQNDPGCRVIVGSIGAMGVGLTLTASSTVLFAELSWVPADVTQAEDRCHRIGQAGSVNIVHVVLDGSLDQRMAEVLLEKQEVADQALDQQVSRPEPQLVALPTERGEQRPRKEPSYPAEVKAAVLEALRTLAGMCDGAVREDGCGYSKIDVTAGHSLANRDSLTDRQTWLGLKFCRKYHRQLGAEVAELVKKFGQTKKEV